MNRPWPWLIPALAILSLAGCGSDAGSDAGTDTNTADPGGEMLPPDCPQGTTVVLTDDDNYTFSGSMDIRSYTLAALGDPLFDWSGLKVDLQGHAMNPAGDVDQAAVIVFTNITEEEIEAGLSTNTLEQSHVTLFTQLKTAGATSAHLSEFTVFGNDIDVEQYFEEGYGVWLLTITRGTVPGVGTLMAAFLRPEATASAITLELTKDSTVLDFTVDLESLEGVPFPPSTPDAILDWSGLTAKGDGMEFVAGDVDEVMVAHYTDLTPTDLEKQFLDVELLADEVWTADVASGTTLELIALSGATGPFPGIDDEGTWLLTLRCTTCANPVPPFLTLLKYCQ
ncbi:MAG: hypothetical protein ISR64_05660 [Deltaproteobacteria bacterium]|nr:hypothetical protein [Deltaproteobacteria bacterium]